MATINSPNMNLPVPVVGQEPGPNYATDVNNSLNTVDSHDHSPGKGVKINPSGIYINAVLNMNDNQLTNVQSVNFDEQSSTIATLGALYSAPGVSSTGISDLWYTDFAGNTIQITKSGAVYSTALSIPGESYGAGKFTWQQVSPDNAGAPALFDTGSITLRPDVVGTTNGTTLVGSTTNSVTITLPLPQTEGYTGVPNFVTMDQSGNQANTYYLDNSTLNASGNVIEVKPGGITSTQIAANAVGNSQIANNAVTLAQIATGQSFQQATVISTTGSVQSFTVPTGVTNIRAFACGGGGGGGGGQSAGGGGGAGCVPVLASLAVSSGDTLSITIGAGGAAGTPGNGTAGGDTFIYGPQASFTANTTFQSNVLTNVSNFTNVRIGQTISGTGVPTNAVVESFNSGASTITMTLVATSTASGTSFTSKQLLLYCPGGNGGGTGVSGGGTGGSGASTANGTFIGGLYYTTGGAGNSSGGSGQNSVYAIGGGASNASGVGGGPNGSNGTAGTGYGAAGGGGGATTIGGQAGGGGGAGMFAGGGGGGFATSSNAGSRNGGAGYQGVCILLWSGT